MANKFTFNFDFTGKTDNLEKSLNDLQIKFKSLQLPNNIGDNLKKKIEQASDALDNFKNISNKKTFNDTDVRKINQGYEKLTDLLEDIGLNYQKLKNVKDTQLLSQAELDKFKELKKSFNDVISLQEKYTKAVKDYNDARKDIKNSGYATALKEVKKRLDLSPNTKESTVLQKVDRLSAELKGRKKLTPEETDLKNQLRAFDDLYKKQKGLNDQLDKTEEALKKILGVDSLSKVIPKFEDIEAVKTFRKELQDIPGIDLSSASLDELKKQLDNLPKEKADEVRKKITDLGDSLKDIAPAAKKAEEGIRDFNDEGEHSKEVAGEIENLSNRFKQFFSITSGFYLLRNAVRSAYTAVQELDAVMTETAVVTNFTVGNMWKQLPQYTEVANELGVATKDVYEAATLYYQQGLDQQQVEQLNIATLKLARIASLNAAEATDRMTNALRGFNMELNETNANRIADVYSKLAAITAADVDEISTAMTKTASIASSAGMQFETTAAFLSQIIETTRESAETAGTALKTVIARFQELKKAPDEIGEVEGEIVDANKVEGALRTVGISLRDASGQFRELDKVFLELSSKWNSLDKNTQRYIATIAAGSRQQSRFIAMMQNYTHTMELVDAANNAAGASQQQYEKTLESLESKLARLKNAWNEFALTLANADLIKGTVDALNGLLTTVNKLTGDSGLAKLGVLAGTFGGGKALASKLFGKEGKILEVSKIVGKKIKAGIVSGLGKGVGVLGEKTIFKDLLDDSNFNKNLGTIFTFSTGSLKGIKESLLAIIGYRKIDLDLIQKEGDAQKAFEAAVAAGKTALSGYIGIAAAVAAAIFIIYKTWKNNTPEERLKRQIQLTTDLEKETERVKATLDELKDAEVSLGEQYQNLDKLTEGTKKWNSALAETNEKVLDLLEKFPALAGAISNDNGVLKIDFNSDAYKNFIEQQKKQVIFDQVGTSSSKIGEVERREEIALKEAIRKTGFNKENVVQIAKLVAEGTVRIDGEGGLTGIEKLEQIGEGLTGWSNWQQKIIENIDVLRDFGQTLRADKIQIEAHKEVVKDDLISGFEEADQKILDAVDDFINYSDGIDKDIEKQYMPNGLHEIKRRDLEKDFAEAQYGAGSTVNFKGQIHGANGEYKGMIPEVQEMLRTLSREKNIKNYTENIEKLNEDLKSEEARKRLGDLREILTGEKISREKLPNIQELTNSYIEGIYNSLNSAYPGLFGDFKNFLRKVRSRIEEEASVVAKVTEGEGRYGKFNSDISSKVLEGVFNNLDNVRISHGAAAAQQIADLLKKETNEQVLAELNKVDWSDRAQLEGLITTIEDLGIAADGANVNNLVKQIIELNHATTNLSLEQFTEKITEFASSIENVKGKVEDGVKTFSKSEYESLISAGANASDFVRTGADQYTYGGETVDLLSTINGNLVTLVNDYNKNLQERIAQGKRIDSLSDADKANLLAINTGDSQNLKNEIEQAGESYLEYLKEIGEKIGLKVAGLGEDELEKALGQAYENYGLGGITYRQNQNTYEGQLRSSRELLYSEQNGQGMLNLYGQIGDEKALKAVQKIRIEENKLQVQLAKTTKAFKDNNKETKVSDEMLASLVIDVDKSNQKLKAYVETYDKLEDTLKNADKTSIEYYQALSELGEAAENIFGVDFSNEFISNNAEDLMALAQGGEKGEEAFKRLAKAAAELVLEDYNLENASDKVAQAIDLLDQANFDVEGTADFSEIFAQLVALVGSAEAAQDVLNALGYEAEFEYEWVPVLNGVNLEQDTVGGASGAEGGGISYVKVLKSVSAIHKKETNLDNFRTPKTSGGGGSSKKENDNKWENPYNILYNHIERVNELLRERNKIEFEYNKLIRDNSDAVKVEASLYKEVLANLEEQRKEQQYIYNQAKEGYREQLKDIPYDKYLEEVEDAAVKAAGKTRIQQLAGYDFEKNQVYIDWSGIADYEQELKAGGLSDDEAKILNALTSVTDYLKDTESNMDAAEDALREIDNTIYDIQQNLREAYIEFEDRVITAIENIRQQEIDNQKQTNEALDSAASDLLNSIRSNIDKMRQDRANENTEEELARKERRLAYLRMDTSGSHNTEIAKLEKELRESQLDYADTLVDQSLQEMQDQNDAAAEQRERQITLMEDQLEWDKENAVIAHQAAKLIENSKNEGYITESSPLYKVLYDGEGWGSKSVASLENTLKAVQEGFSKAIVAINEGLVDPYYGDFSTEIDRQINRMLKALEDGDSTLADSIAANIVRLNSARNAKINQEGLEWKKYNSEELIAAAKNGSYSSSWWDVKVPGQGKQSNNNINNNNNTQNNTDSGEGAYAFLEDYEQLMRVVKNNGQAVAEVTSSAYKSKQLKPKDWVVTQGGAYQIRGIDANGNYISSDDDNPDIFIPLWAYRKLGGPSYRQYLSGGLADFTGPAWLDGTPSKPEVVLNARDSENLIQLRDILRNNQNSGTNIGDSYFDIDINVDEIAGDYDVDRMVDRIKQIIYNDSTRNQVYIPR